MRDGHGPTTDENITWFCYDAARHETKDGHAPTSLENMTWACYDDNGDVRKRGSNERGWLVPPAKADCGWVLENATGIGVHPVGPGAKLLTISLKIEDGTVTHAAYDIFDVACDAKRLCARIQGKSVEEAARMLEEDVHASDDSDWGVAPSALRAALSSAL